MAKTDIAALLALGAALCVAIGDVLEQRATHRITASVGHLELFATLLRNQRWRWGALMIVVSIALQAAALGQGSVLLVQALLVLSLLFALPISARLSHRAVTGREWVWALLLTAAVNVIVTVGPPAARSFARIAADLGRSGGGAGAAASRMCGGCPDLGWCAGGGAVRLRVGVALGGCSRCSPKESSPDSATARGRRPGHPSYMPGCWSHWAVSRGSSQRSGLVP